MTIKRPFAKKTAQMKNEKAKKWAQDLKDIYEPLINCANAAKEIKILLKKLDGTKETDDKKKEKYKADILTKWQGVFGNFKTVRDSIVDCFGTKGNEEPTLEFLNELI